MKAKNVTFDIIRTKFPILLKIIEYGILPEDKLETLKTSIYKFSDFTELFSLYGKEEVFPVGFR